MAKPDSEHELQVIAENDPDLYNKLQEDINAEIIRIKVTTDIAIKYRIDVAELDVEIAYMYYARALLCITIEELKNISNKDPTN